MEKSCNNYPPRVKHRTMYKGASMFVIGVVLVAYNSLSLIGDAQSNDLSFNRFDIYLFPCSCALITYL